MTYAAGRDGTPIQMLECHQADCPPDGPSLETIRKILLEDDATALAAAQQPTPSRPADDGPASRFPELTAPERFETLPALRPERQRVNPMAPLARRIKRFQPSWKLSCAILLAAALVAGPWLVVGFVALIAVCGTLIALCLGGDRRRALSGWVWTRYRTRFPDQADRLNTHSQRISDRMGRLLDRLPARWTAGLYLPDFATTSIPHEKLSEDPFDRLS